MYLFLGDLLTSCPSKSISPRPKKNPSLPRCCHSRSCRRRPWRLHRSVSPSSARVSSTRSPSLPPCSPWIDGPRTRNQQQRHTKKTDWLKIFEDISSYLIELEEVIGEDFDSLSWARDSQKYLNLSKGSKRDQKNEFQKLSFDIFWTCYRCGSCCSGTHDRLFYYSPSCHVKRKIWRQNRLWGKNTKDMEHSTLSKPHMVKVAH